MPAVPDASPDTPRLPALRDLARYFTWLGLTGFGGPIVLCGLMERDLAEQRGWLDQERMRDVIAVCQTLPGPLAVQVAIFIGYLRAGVWGAVVAGWSLILPASVMVGGLAAAYVHLHDLPWLAAVIYGVSPAVIALILQSWWRLTRGGVDDGFQYVVGAACVAATLLWPNLLTAMFLAAGALSIAWYRPRRKSRDLHDLGPLLLTAKLAAFFLMTGAFTFGSALSIVPFLRSGLVGTWMTADAFLTAIAVGMVTPGPVMTAATFAGYLIAGPLGAIVCTIAIYLPSFLLVLLVAPVLMRHRDNPTVQGFVKGVYAAAMGAILAAALTLGRRAIDDWTTAAIALASLVALLRFRLAGPLLVGAAAAIGLVAVHLR